MGQAKRRGSYEHRKAMAMIKAEEERIKALPVSGKEKCRRYKGQMLLLQTMAMIAGLEIGDSRTRGK